MLHGRNLIGGSWVESASTRLNVTNPVDEAVIGTIPVGHPDDIDAAVVAARAAFPGWSARPLDERVGLVSALADLVEERHSEFTDLVVAEIGCPRRTARWAQVGLSVADLRSAIDGAGRVEWEADLGSSIVIREAIGVAGCITPWNYPLHQITAKIGAALVAGCTVVLKPSEVSPFSAEALLQAAIDVGVPPGVLNLVHGLGPNVGEPLAAHRDVDVVSFTGSTAVGRRVAEVAAQTVKRVALELGGKSASVILADADLTQAVPKTLRSSFLNGGQSCNAQTRMIVQRDQLAEVERLLVDAVAAYAPGHPDDEATKLGPMVTAQQRDRVVGYIRDGIASGARLLVGGAEPPAGLEEGYFVQPTVFVDVDPEMRIAQEEIFGPVLCVIAVDDEEQAVEVANATMYGIGGGVWAGDDERALAVARRLRTAQIDVNGGAFNNLAPFGGYKQSGNGRENGTFGVEEFLEVKSIQQPRRS